MLSSVLCNCCSLLLLSIPFTYRAHFLWHFIALCISSVRLCVSSFHIFLLISKATFYRWLLQGGYASSLQVQHTSQLVKEKDGDLLEM